jgi:hypothetical protein
MVGRARRVVAVAVLVAMTLLGTALAPAGASTGSGGGGGKFRPGAPGVGDDYFPLYGNGGYDVRHYLLKVSTTRPPTAWSGWPPSRPGRPRTCPGSISTSSA